MTRTPLWLATLLAAAFAGCATTTSPAPTTSALADCTVLAARIANADADLRTARDAERDAWKAVVPFAVAARYAKGHSAAGEAEQRLVELQADSARQDCAHHVR